MLLIVTLTVSGNLLFTKGSLGALGGVQDSTLVVLDSEEKSETLDGPGPLSGGSELRAHDVGLSLVWIFPDAVIDDGAVPLQLLTRPPPGR